MATVTFKLIDFYSLQTEINGAFNQQANQLIIRGLINETTKLTTKMKVAELLNKVSVEVEALNAKRNELVEKHGDKQEDGTAVLSPFINVQTNEEG